MLKRSTYSEDVRGALGRKFKRITSDANSELVLHQNLDILVMVANPTIYFCEICSIDCDFAWHNMLQGAPRQQSGVWHSTNWTLAISFPHSGRCCWISTKNHVTALVPLESRFFRIEDSKMYFSLTHESTSSLGCSKTPLGTDNSSHQTPCPLVLMQRNGRPHTRKPWVAGREASFHRPDIYWWKPLAMKAMWVCQKIMRPSPNLMI